MDDALVDVALSFEGRPLPRWLVQDPQRIEGFVDAWYGDDGLQAGWASGTNLRQFIDGFAYGSGATVVLTVTRVGNLHHFYECMFRGLGDAVRSALGLTGSSVPGESSGLAGDCRYTVEPAEPSAGAIGG
jgi:imidazoleglycerol phosphate dehydratase HisB